MYQIAVANNKGGVGKTTTAVTLASLLAGKGPTLLVDADEMTAGALEWASAGPGLGCEVIRLEDMGALDVQAYTYVIFDTKAGEGADALLTIARAVDLLIVPVKPDGVSLRALAKTLEPLIQAGVSNYKVLLSDVPPAPSSDGHDARAGLMDLDVPVFTQAIRRAAAFNKAASSGVVVRDVRGDSRAKLAYRDYELVLKEALK